MLRPSLISFRDYCVAEKLCASECVSCFISAKRFFPNRFTGDIYKQISHDDRIINLNRIAYRNRRPQKLKANNFYDTFLCVSLLSISVERAFVCPKKIRIYKLHLDWMTLIRSLIKNTKWNNRVRWLAFVHFLLWLKWEMCAARNAPTNEPDNNFIPNYIENNSNG